MNCFMHKIDVYEESEADLMSERNNNNDTYRFINSRSPEVKGMKTDNRKLSSGYFVCYICV